MKKSEIIKELRRRKGLPVSMWIMFFIIVGSLYFLIPEGLRKQEVLNEIDITSDLLSALLVIGIIFLYALIVEVVGIKLSQLILKCWTPTTKQIVKYDNERRVAIETGITASKEDIMRLERRIGELEECIKSSEEQLANWEFKEE
ncbi:hypothetical protein FACS189428_5700 [Clostridia bacterium]|nr:hypothetical protein FACS189428_5700 [Clostridia bacterium]